jgi:hypothetical protein
MVSTISYNVRFTAEAGFGLIWISLAIPKQKTPLQTQRARVPPESHLEHLDADIPISLPIVPDRVTIDMYMNCHGSLIFFACNLSKGIGTAKFALQPFAHYISQLAKNL